MQIYLEYRLKPVSNGKISMGLIIARKRKVRKKNCTFILDKEERWYPPLPKRNWLGKID